MCLKNRSEEMVAEFDIPCYVIRRVSRNNVIKSMFRKFKWIILKLYKDTKNEMVEKTSVHGGFFHSFLTNEIRMFRYEKMYLAIIPKGSRYYMGIQLGRWWFASKQLMLIEEVC